MSKFIFNYGVVNSRKSSELLLTIHRNVEIANKSACILQSDVNTRDGGRIKSRALTYEVDAKLISKDTNLKDVYKGEELIFIDEIQFFTTEHIDQLIDIMMNNDVIIFAYGLMSNFKGKLFETVAYMLPFITKIVEIPTVCEVCGDAKATMNLLVADKQGDSDGIIVGNHFKGVCVKCWYENNKKVLS